MTLTQQAIEDRLSKLATMRFDLATCRGHLMDCQSIARRAAGEATKPEKKEYLLNLAEELQPFIDGLKPIHDKYVNQFWGEGSTK